MLGNAKASTVLSTAISNTGSMSTASANHARRGVGMDVVVASSWADIRLLLRTTSGRKPLRSRLIRVDGALGKVGHDGVDHLDAGGALARGLVACVEQRPEHQSRPT